MGSTPDTLRLLANSIDSLNHERLRRIECQCKGKLIRDGFNPLLFSIPYAFPIAIPNSLPREGRPCNARPRAVQPFGVAKLTRIDIGERGVRQIQVIYAPGGNICLPRFASLLREKRPARSQTYARSGPEHSRCSTTTLFYSPDVRNGRAGIDNAIPAVLLCREIRPLPPTRRTV